MVSRARTERTLLGTGPRCTPDRTVGVGIEIRAGDLLAGKYEALSLIGTGAASFVMAAHHRGFDSDVALKFFSPELVSHDEAARRFATEYNSHMLLRSEHIVRVFDVERLSNGQPFLVMERLYGYDLRVALADRGRLSIERALEFALQICEALATAHAVGIAHLDLKPENLFVTGMPHDEQLKVLDFGICRAVHASSHRVATLSAQGSPPYMSPEQMRGSAWVDERSDIWSLGCVLYEMLSGRSPFARASLPQACAAVLEEPAHSVRQLRVEPPAELAHVVMSCLEKDVELRPQTVVELAQALARFAPGKARQHVRRCQQIFEEHGVLRVSGVHPLGEAQRMTPVMLLPKQLKRLDAVSAPKVVVGKASLPRNHGLAVRRLLAVGMVAFCCYASLRPGPRPRTRRVSVADGLAAESGVGGVCEQQLPEPVPELLESVGVSEPGQPVEAAQPSAAELRRAEKRKQARDQLRSPRAPR